MKQLVLENEAYSLTVNGGIITSFIEKRYPHINLADMRGKLGTACYTRVDEDIRFLPHGDFTPYTDRCADYTEWEMIDDNKILCRDTKSRITAEYRMEESGVFITCETDNQDISGFGVNVDLNYMGKKGADYQNQLLPTSPYTSENGKYMYCIMTRPDGRFMVITAMTECDGWKISYSPFSWGHYIMNVQFLASFDKAYGGSGRGKIIVNLQCADTLGQVFEKIQALYQMPLCTNILSGGFRGNGQIKIYGQAEELLMGTPSGMTKKEVLSTTCKEKEAVLDLQNLEEFGFYTITPISDGMEGLSTTLWNGGDMLKLFDKSCDAVKKPYHGDRNLCEGGCFLWAMLLNMRLGNHRKYDKIVCEELDVIMGKREYIPGRTIVPRELNDFPAYHIYRSKRVQSQFFGVSILLEAYRVYGKEEILEFAVNTLQTLVEYYMIKGKVFNGEDYTTVCCPAIPLVDMAVFLKNRKDERYRIFERASLELAEYLCNRGFSFPTEGIRSDLVNEEYEDGSISCTALSLLYVCAHLTYRQEYVDFAEKVLTLHNAWTVYTPDARMQGSSFRWWETIWEGDGEGPAICAGHAWTIWRAEALFWYGYLKKDENALKESWNGFITNFCKTQADGSMYSCYEVDYIRGGGMEDVKKSRMQLQGEDVGIQYRIAHDYPLHKDNSLSRYAWARAAETWMRFHEYY